MPKKNTKAPPKKRQKNKAKIDGRSMKERMQTLIQTYAATCNIMQACKQARIGRETHHQWLKKYPRYAAAFEETKKRGAEYLESVAVERSSNGWLEPIFYQGVRCGSVRRYDGSTLQFLLRGMLPQKYTQKTELTGPQGQPIAAKIEVVFREPEPDKKE